MGVIEVKDNVIAEEKVKVLSTPSIRMRLFAKLLGQDVKSVQSAMHWKMNQDTPGTETIFKPFGVLTPQDFRNVYDRCGLVRYACEKMSRDIFQNGFPFQLITSIHKIVFQSRNNILPIQTIICGNVIRNVSINRHRIGTS
ncbi:hypothetical protein LCGC14_2290450 [marine sediment metagenome]|uniref:Uncharacterized protein n=1 Tax=marine sediment metagenome TaxID=412755 RepID=A0A0F9FLM8_9ZZZZ